MNILVINPGSTSTKIGLYNNEEQIFEQTLRHSAQELEPFPTIPSQKDFRKNIIIEFLKEKNISLETLNAVVGRGGLVKPLPGGTYTINQRLIEDLEKGIQGEHASNLGGLLAYEIAQETNIPSYIVDPVVVDEFENVARFSGIKNIQRRSAFHALNQKAIAKKYCKENNKNYEETNLLVVHMGGGISVGAHKNGKVIDVTNAIQGEGPFTPERSGELPLLDVVDLCYSEEFTKKEMYSLIKGKGGFNSYLETTDVKEIIDKAMNHSQPEKSLYEAFIYQVAKEIGKFSTVLYGDVEVILLTGGVAYSKEVVNDITKRVKFIAPIKAYPGEEELLALAQGAIRVLNDEEKSLEYT
jgi:butyrate kinase